MGCGCQGRADAIAGQLHAHPHRTAAVAVGLAAGAAAVLTGLIFLALKVRQSRG
jgi:hypothetical protein